jgi:hemolysin III
MVAMFGASALYHRGNWSLATAKRLLQLDHTAIFLMIAGTYTPIALLATDGTTRVATLTAVWVVAAAGIVFEWMPVPAPRGYVTTVYMCLGWIGAFSFVPLYDSTGWGGVLLIAGGGLLYTIGAIVHAAHKPDPWPDTFGYHEIFHVFVILAALLHYCAIAFLVLPLD